MTRIKSTLVLSSLCANYRRLQDPLSIRHIQKKPNQGHGRTPTWRKVTTERISLSADQTQALLHVKITVLDLFHPAGCWPGLTPPPRPRCHVPRHDAHVVQKHVGGEWVNRKKKGTAALLLKIWLHSLTHATVVCFLCFVVFFFLFINIFFLFFFCLNS